MTGHTGQPVARPWKRNGNTLPRDAAAPGSRKLRPGKGHAAKPALPTHFRWIILSQIWEESLIRLCFP